MQIAGLRREREREVETAVQQVKDTPQMTRQVARLYRLFVCLFLSTCLVQSLPTTLSPFLEIVINVSSLLCNVSSSKLSLSWASVGYGIFLLSKDTFRY